MHTPKHRHINPKKTYTLRAYKHSSNPKLLVILSNPYYLCVQYSTVCMPSACTCICLMKAWKQCQHIATEKKNVQIYSSWVNMIYTQRKTRKRTWRGRFVSESVCLHWRGRRTEQFYKMWLQPVHLNICSVLGWVYLHIQKRTGWKTNHINGLLIICMNMCQHKDTNT